MVENQDVKTPTTTTIEEVDEEEFARSSKHVFLFYVDVLSEISMIQWKRMRNDCGDQGLDQAVLYWLVLKYVIK